MRARAVRATWKVESEVLLLLAAAIGATAGAAAGCGPQIDKFTVHAGPLAGSVTPPPPVGGEKATAEIEVSPKQSSTQRPAFTFTRIAPDPRTFPPIPASGTSSLQNLRESHSLEIPAAGHAFTDGTPPLLLSYPSSWSATVIVPYVTSGPTQTVSRGTTFQVTVPASCVGFDADTEHWNGSPVFRYIPSLGPDGQPNPPQQLGTVSLTWSGAANWPIAIAGTGSVSFAIPPQLATASMGAGGQDDWYVRFSGPAKPGMRDGAGLEIWLRGVSMNAQAGLELREQNGDYRILYGAMGSHTEIDGWRRVRAPWAQKRATESIVGGVWIRLEGRINEVRNHADERIVIDHIAPY